MGSSGGFWLSGAALARKALGRQTGPPFRMSPLPAIEGSARMRSKDPPPREGC
jgi:hypothetical protein